MSGNDEERDVHTHLDPKIGSRAWNLFPASRALL